MKRIAQFMSILLASIFQGCGSPGSAPTKDEIIGIWISPEGAELHFKKDGTFTGKTLPAEIFIIDTPEYQGKKFDCDGEWLIKGESKSSDQLPWVVYLDIKSSSNDYNGSTSILVSGSNFLENKAPWNYLFLWQGEEGGLRYKFEKK